MTYLTTTEVAARLGVTADRVRKMILAGRLAAERFGRDWRIAEKSLAALGDRKPGWRKGRPRKDKTQ